MRDPSITLINPPPLLFSYPSFLHELPVSKRIHITRPVHPSPFPSLFLLFIMTLGRVEPIKATFCLLAALCRHKTPLRHRPQYTLDILRHRKHACVSSTRDPHHPQPRGLRHEGSHEGPPLRTNPRCLAPPVHPQTGTRKGIRCPGEEEVVVVPSVGS